MYLHLGGQTIVPSSSVIGIFDLDRVSQSKRTRLFLERAEKAGQVKAVGAELPASFVLCHGNGKCTVYLSPIASKTLGKRGALQIADNR